MIYSSKKKISNNDIKFLEKENIKIFNKTPFRDTLFYSPKEVSLKVKNEYMLNFLGDINNNYFLSTLKAQTVKTTIKISDDLIFGSNQTILMAGPCSAESEEQVTQVANFIKSLNIKVFRAGCFKPRTSPFSFQGLGEDGLKILKKVCEKLDLKIISEVKDSSHFKLVENYVDIIQVGTKAMYDQSLLKMCGKSQKPILLKRGFMTTLKEYLQACDFILQEGNWRVILCERGIRTFEPMTRFTLDLGSASILKQISHLPIVIDPSHAIGLREHVINLASASVAMKIDGLLIEVHGDPPNSFSDARQAMYFEDFKELQKRCKSVCSSVGKKLI